MDYNNIQEEVSNLVHKAGDVFALSTESGVRPNTIYRLLRGERPSLDTVMKLERTKSTLESGYELINN